MKNFNSTLKGTEVEVINLGGKGGKCFVVEVDYEQGITIKAFETQEEIFCLNKNKMPEGDNYDDVFKFVINQIKSGKLSEPDLMNFLNRSANITANMVPCAFE